MSLSGRQTLGGPDSGPDLAQIAGNYTSTSIQRDMTHKV